MTKKKVVSDMILNIIAAALPVALLQLIIYPHLAKILGGDEYGLMLTIYSIWIMISNSLGNVLNNIKLLKNPQYEEFGEEGDIEILLRQWLGAGSALVFIVIWVYCGCFNATHILLGTLTSATIFLKAYLEVGFRLKLNYIAIAINSVMLGVGFCVGTGLFELTGCWEFVFLAGYMLSVIFCVVKTRLLWIGARKTKMYKEVSRDSYYLVISAIISNCINYADKLILYPLMGGTAVSIYYTATILGKITGMLTGPINSVILSYISRWDNSKSKFFNIILGLGFVTIAVGYVVTMLLARPVLGILFPQWVDDVMEIIPFTTATVMLTVLTSILQPFVLKFCNIYWQIMISGVGSAAYFVSALVLWKIYGLNGFCIGTIIGAVVKIVIMIAVYYSRDKNVKSSL